MQKGLLITNSFLRTEKFLEHYLWLSEAAKKHGISLTIQKGTDFFLPFGNGIEETLYEQIKPYAFILFWDKDIPLGKRLSLLAERYSIPMFNPIDAIDVCDDKIAAYDQIAKWNLHTSVEKKIPLIPTLAAPMTYQNVGYTELSFTKKVITEFGLPLVIKECRGSFGQQVYLAKTEDEVFQLTKQLEGIPFLYQKFLSESSGRDVRLQVVGDKVVACMYRYSVNGDFRANLSSGGKMKKYSASEEEKTLAIRTVKALGLDFAGVDLLFSRKDSEADRVCEVNSNAHFKNIFACTGVNTAECIMKYIKSKLSKLHT